MHVQGAAIVVTSSRQAPSVVDWGTMTRRLIKILTDYSDPNSFASRLRRRRMAPLAAMIRACHARRGAVSIIDVGGSRLYWDNLGQDFLRAHGARVTILNNDPAFVETDDDLYLYRRGDGCDLGAYDTDCFDIAHSNSVIEHVGGWRRMAAFAAEQSRVGRACFAQTPNFWFPVEPHFATPLVHWLPRPILVHLLMRRDVGNMRRAADLGRAYACVDGIRLLDRAMMTTLFPDCILTVERFCGLAKSFVALREEC